MTVYAPLIEIGKDEGARVVTGGERAQLGGDLNGGYYVQPTIFEGNNKMRRSAATSSPASAARTTK